MKSERPTLFDWIRDQFIYASKPGPPEIVVLGIGLLLIAHFGENVLEKLGLFNNLIWFSFAMTPPFFLLAWTINKLLLFIGYRKERRRPERYHKAAESDKK